MDSAVVGPSEPFVLLLFGDLSGSMEEAKARPLIRREVYLLINFKGLGRNDMEQARKLVQTWQPVFIPFLMKQKQFVVGQA